jgi:DNA-directed RNA polymerase subunit M/transcription elongation factor TFIIS
MGIRFFCPECQNRLNVKSFLAGKRGICPKCEARFLIPAESDPQAEKSETASKATASKATASKATASKATASKANQAADPAADEAPHSGLRVEPAEKNRPTEASHSKPNPATEPQTPTAKLTIPNVDGPQNSNEDAPAAAPVVAQHPTDVDPAKVWYVRPRTGGEFGPADGPLMKRWIGEGRVAGDSLAWREGWDDWQTASIVFPELADNSPPVTAANNVASAPIATASNLAAATQRPLEDVHDAKPQTLSSRPSAGRGTVPRRATGRGKWTAAVIVLSIIAVVLVVLLFMVLPNAF